LPQLSSGPLGGTALNERAIMINHILPAQIDNTYKGSKIALFLFAIVVFVKTLQSLLALFDGNAIASSADGIPLDTFSNAGIQAFVAVFALYAFARLILFSLSVLVLLRYRSVISFMFALLVLDYLGRLLILYFLPLPRSGTPLGPIVNMILFVLLIVGLILSLRRSRGAA
jgi:hypothetical protein